MGCKSYESDKYGRITVYPSLSNPGRKSPGILPKLINKLVDIVIGKNKTS